MAAGISGWAESRLEQNLNQHLGQEGPAALDVIRGVRCHLGNTGCCGPGVHRDFLARDRR
jgi:hypothetical protein